MKGKRERIGSVYLDSWVETPVDAFIDRIRADVDRCMNSGKHKYREATLVWEGDPYEHELTIMAERDLTPRELETAKQARKVRIALNKKKKEALETKERAEFERLKKKFG